MCIVSINNWINRCINKIVMISNSVGGLSCIKYTRTFLAHIYNCADKWKWSGKVQNTIDVLSIGEWLDSLNWPWILRRIFPKQIDFKQLRKMQWLLDRYWQRFVKFYSWDVHSLYLIDLSKNWSIWLITFISRTHNRFDPFNLIVQTTTDCQSGSLMENLDRLFSFFGRVY